MARAELLVELRFDEVPAAYLPAAARQFRERMVSALRERGLAPRRWRTSHSARRLVLQCAGVAKEAPSSGTESIAGPPVRAAYDERGQPTNRLQRFLEEHGGAVDELVRERQGRGEVVVLKRPAHGPTASAIIGELVPRVVLEMVWPQEMRWGNGLGPWVRPLRGLLVVYAGEVVPCEVFGVEATASTVGHPFLSRRPFAVRDYADYERKLSARGVEVDVRARRHAFLALLRSRARELGGEVVEDVALLYSIVDRAEIPRLVDGRLELEFLSLPRELVAVSLRERIEAFVIGTKGSLLPFFLAAMDRPNDPQGLVRRGFEAAATAALADVRFLYERDRREPLAQRYRRLQTVPLEETGGTYGQKTERIADLTSFLCDELGLDQVREAAVEAANLLKADLTTELVRELPMQQGRIGGVLARDEGYPESIWQAIHDHGLAVTRDQVPRGVVGKLVALADRFDSLVGLAGAEGGPTDERLDRVRELAEEAVRLVLAGDLALDLDLVAARAVRLHGESLGERPEVVLQRFRPLLDSSVRAVLLELGAASDEIEAVLASGESTSLPIVQRRLEALQRLRKEEGFGAVVVAARRLLEVLGDSSEHTLDPTLLVEEAEKDLFVLYQKQRAEIDRCVAEGSWKRWLQLVVELGAAVERFFTEVLIHDENEKLRANRLALLQGVHRLLSRKIRLAALDAEEVGSEAPAAKERARSRGAEARRGWPADERG